MSIDPNEFVILLAKWTDHTISSSEHERLSDCLRSNEEYREQFCRSRLYDHLIEEAFDHSFDTDNFSIPLKNSRLDAVSPTSSFRWFRRLLVPSLLAPVMLLVAFYGGARFFSQPGNEKTAQSTGTSGAVFDPTLASTEKESSGRFGQIVRLNQAIWTDRTKTITERSIVSKGERLELESGSMEIVGDAGVHIIVEGPAGIDVYDFKHIKISHGKFTARVQQEGIGFTIETPSGIVVDQGTEFSVDVDLQGETKVVVYRGNVDVYHRPDANDPTLFAMDSTPVSLNMGEGLLFRQNIDPEPISSIESDYFLPAAISRPPKSSANSSVITSVRDNIRDVTKKFYEVVPRGFGEDVLAYVDRRHEWNGVTTEGLPEFLIGGDMVRTFNEDKFREDFQMTVTLSAPARFFVLYDNRCAVPDWLLQDFVVTEYRIGLDEGIFPHEYEKHYDRMKLKTPEERIPANFTATRICEVGPGNNVDYIFTVWERKTMEPGEIKLGGLPPQESKNPLHQSFYGIVAVPTHEFGR